MLCLSGFELYSRLVPLLINIKNNLRRRNNESAAHEITASGTL